MQKAIALALLLAFPAFAQEAPRRLALVPAARLLAAAPAPAGEECAVECDPLYYDPATGDDCVQVCDEPEEDGAEAEQAEEEPPQVVQAVQPPRQDNPTAWLLVALGLALAIGISSFLVATQCDPNSGKPCR